jgi:hypothetical protein
MIKYGLREKSSGKLLGCTKESNRGRDCCGEYTNILYPMDSGREDPVWLTDTLEQALFVQHYTTEWYNADYDTPQHGMDWEPDDLEVVTYEIVVNALPEQDVPHVPTEEEFVEVIHRNDSAENLEYHRNRLKEKRREFRPDLWHWGEYWKYIKEQKQ